MPPWQQSPSDKHSSGRYLNIKPFHLLVISIAVEGVPRAVHMARRSAREVLSKTFDCTWIIVWVSSRPYNSNGITYDRNTWIQVHVEKWGETLYCGTSDWSPIHNCYWMTFTFDWFYDTSSSISSMAFVACLALLCATVSAVSSMCLSFYLINHWFLFGIYAM